MLKWKWMLKIVDRLVGSVVSTSLQVLRGLGRLWGSRVMTGFTLSRHLGNNNAPLSAHGGSWKESLGEMDWKIEMWLLSNICSWIWQPEECSTAMKDIRRKYIVKWTYGAMSCENIGTKSNSGRDDMNGYLLDKDAYSGLGNVAVISYTIHILNMCRIWFLHFIHIRQFSNICLSGHLKQARKPRSYTSLKLRPLTDSECRATSAAKNTLYVSCKMELGLFSICMNVFAVHCSALAVMQCCNSADFCKASFTHTF